MLPAKLDEEYRGAEPHFYGGQQLAMNRRGSRLSANLVRPRDSGAEGENWRNILLDQFRRRGTNFFGV